MAQPGSREQAEAHPWRRILLIVAFVVAAGAFASLLGWDIRGWFERLWDTITTISAEYVVAGVVAETVKTTATAFAWYSILLYAYPGEARFRQVFAAYSACVALNFILPANLGTIVMFIMLTTVIASATFAGMIGGREDAFVIGAGFANEAGPLQLRLRDKSYDFAHRRAPVIPETTLVARSEYRARPNLIRQP